MPRPSFASSTLRFAPVYAALMFALLVMGTAKAQSSLPGDPLYGWKRTSEEAWLSVSPDPVGTELVLADRRLNEWLAVEKDPERSATAMHDYMTALIDLNTADDKRARARILPVLEAHQKKLKASGLANQPASQPLYTLLVVAANVTPTAPPEETAVVAAVSSSTPRPSNPAPSDTAVPTQALVAATAVPPTATASATAVPPTATEVPPTPTQFVPTATDTPTVVAPTPTDTPTEIAPTPTDVPTEVVPTDTPEPTDVPPMPTDTPPGSLGIGVTSQDAYP